MPRHVNKIQITGLEANLLLYALDDYYKTDELGRVTEDEKGYDIKSIQRLRDRLFAAHQHPESFDYGSD